MSGQVQAIGGHLEEERSDRSFAEAPRAKITEH